MKKALNRDFLKGMVVAGILASGFYAATSSGAVPLVHSIKPTAKQTVALSDEQQGILAVRSAKAAVVSIVGSSVDPNSTSTAPQLYSSGGVAGTGFIVSSDGLIVSNNHVVEDSSLTYIVTMADGTQYTAKVLGLDKYDDVAILKIEAKGLPVAKLGDSGSLETGQTVFTIGNSLGKYEDTVTRGVVSGLGRSVAEPVTSAIPRLQNLIQTDAAINLGNSGGPLIDMSGAVVGMSTLIDTQGSSLGFAIPINNIKSVVSQLQTYGKVSKPYMGVQFATVTGQIRILKGLTVSQGAYLNSIVPGGPADQVGLKPGDVIVAINHTLLTQNNELDTVVGSLAPGTQILVTYIRNGQQTDASLVLGVLP